MSSSRSMDTEVALHSLHERNNADLSAEHSADICRSSRLAAPRWTWSSSPRFEPDLAEPGPGPGHPRSAKRSPVRKLSEDGPKYSTAGCNEGMKQVRGGKFAAAVLDRIKGTVSNASEDTPGLGAYDTTDQCALGKKFVTRPESASTRASTTPNTPRPRSAAFPQCLLKRPLSAAPIQSSHSQRHPTERRPASAPNRPTLVAARLSQPRRRQGEEVFVPLFAPSCDALLHAATGFGRPLAVASHPSRTLARARPQSAHRNSRSASLQAKADWEAEGLAEDQVLIIDGSRGFCMMEGLAEENSHLLSLSGDALSEDEGLFNLASPLEGAPQLSHQEELGICFNVAADESLGLAREKLLVLDYDRLSARPARGAGNTPGPGHYEACIGALSSRSSKFGHKRRPPLPSKQEACTPGPGAYQLVQAAETRSNRLSSNNNWPRDKRRDLWCKPQFMPEGPGPGHYKVYETFK